MTEAGLWWIGLHSWIIQDGNYPDFTQGQQVEFAVEFSRTKGLSSTDESRGRGWRHLFDNIYDISGIVQFSYRFLILDFGLSVYSITQMSSSEARLRQGDWVEGDIALSVDPFFYAKGHSKSSSGSEHIPPLVYTWVVEVIALQTAPWILAKPDDFLGDAEAERAIAERALRRRDPTRHGWAEILRTDAWEDDGGSAEYLLGCRLMPLPAKWNSRTII
ncbi:MAG: hypothetical protein ACRDPT_06830 [Streptomycetales bacterium]